MASLRKYCRADNIWKPLMNVSDTGRRLRMTWATQLIMFIFMLVCLFVAYMLICLLFFAFFVFCFLLDIDRRLRMTWAT